MSKPLTSTARLSTDDLAHPMRRSLAPVPGRGHIFDIERPLWSTDLDEHQCLRIDGIARQLQEAGVDHLRHTEAMDDHPHWIVRRTVIDVLRPIAWPGRLRLRRWCSGLSPRWCAMRVRIDSDNDGLIETEGFWIHFNKRTQTPARVADRFFEMLSTTTTQHRLRWQPWLTQPPPPTPGHAFPLRRTDIDFFQHVTNTAYWQAVHQFTADEQPPRRLILEYNKPIRYGEQVDIRVAHDGAVTTLWFLVDSDIRAVGQSRPAPPAP